MSGYSTCNQLVSVGGHTYRLRVLSEKQQFSDPNGDGAQSGISSARWRLFGQLWPAGRLLAQAMHRFDANDKRILELACGIGLASLVLQRRGIDVVASDVHPLAEPFLAYNAALNALPALHYRHLRWDLPQPTLGHFDAIIASDVLDEPSHAPMLAAVIERHAHQAAEVLITVPERGQSDRFSGLMTAQGFECVDECCPVDDSDAPPYRGRLLHYTRASRGVTNANSPSSSSPPSK